MAKYYLLAFYLFVLLVALFVVVGVLWRRFFGVEDRRRRVEEDLNAQAATRSREKEEKLFALYRNIEELMDSFEDYVHQTRTAMDEERQAFARQMETLRDEVAALRDAPAPAQAPEPQPEPEPEPLPEPPAPAPARPRAAKPRHEAVRQLLAQGLSEDRVASELDISINEVRLIAFGLNTNHLL